MSASGMRRIIAGFGFAVVLGGCMQTASAQGGTDAPVSTPRQADGRPDLSGYWNVPPMGIAVGGPEGGPGGGLFGPPGGPVDPKDVAITPPLRNGDISNLTNDGVIARRSGDNLPLYKPEYWDKVLQLDFNGNLRDPFNTCMPPSVPRVGAPVRIVQLPNEVFFFYSIIFQRNDFRLIPIGPRTHPIDRDGSWLGDPVGHWDGDTLVVETQGFNDQTWIGPEGYLHGYDLKVTEKFRREGDTIIFDVTVEDPEYLQKPWVFETRRLRRNTTPNFRMAESPPCSERDNSHLQGKNREM